MGADVIDGCRSRGRGNLNGLPILVASGGTRAALPRPASSALQSLVTRGVARFWRRIPNGPSGVLATKAILRPALPTRSGAGADEAQLVQRLPRAGTFNRYLVGLVVLTGAAAAFLAYMVVNVPLVAPTLSREEAVRHWGAAAIGALIVLAVVLLVVSATLRIGRASARATLGASASFPVRPSPGPAIPRSLGWERIAGRAVAIAALVSLALLTAAVTAGSPLWVGGLALLLPWVPLVTLEVAWKHARYGVFAAFAMLVLLQILHMGEHTMQVGQLFATHGELAKSHGVFGQLDFELVHFVTDTAVWLTLGMLIIVFHGENRWLWVAFAAASLHQIEHFYLFWLNSAHQSLYAQGGFAGIMGEGGMIGSPLDRPYLHFAYNFIVVVPMVMALWDAARRVDRRFPT